MKDQNTENNVVQSNSLFWGISNGNIDIKDLNMAQMLDNNRMNQYNLHDGYQSDDSDQSNYIDIQYQTINNTIRNRL